MQRLTTRSNAKRRILSLLASAILAIALPAHAALVNLASAPLANSTTTSVLPNLLFILDTSGSMGQDYTPDYMSDFDILPAPWTHNGDWNAPAAEQKVCRDSADEDSTVNTALTSLKTCILGDVPFMTSAMNTQYYNPAIRYRPGVKADGTEYPSQTNAALVLTDGYNIQNKNQLGTTTTTVDLTTEYPDRIWCTTQTPTAAQLADNNVCRKNSDYLYPDATYKYGRDNNTTVANRDVLGIYGSPYYYDVVVTEYCKEPELRTCTTSSTPTGEYIHPAKSRWCSDLPLTVCQSTKTSTYKYPRYPGASYTATAATGAITLQNITGSTAGKYVSSIKIGGSGGVEILGATVNGSASMNSNALAAAIAAQINTFNSTPEFTASASGNVITLTSTAAAGATANGSWAITASGSTVSSNTAASGGVTGSNAPPYSFNRIDIVPTTTSYPKAVDRDDCADTTCTYQEEITNFANWYTYYRTRLQSMKTAVSRAFLPIGSNYRIGFMNIYKGSYLPINTFSDAVYGVQPVAATGSITLQSAGSTTGKNVSSIKVGTVEILGATVSGSASTSSTMLAAAIATQINNYTSAPEYTATAAGNVVTITSTTVAGAGANGSLSYTATSSTVSAKTNLSGGVTGVGQKSKWYANLFASTASGGTPLRDVLSTAGRVFAGLELSSAGSTSGTTIDPMQYSCQQNFTLLTTDGYWNGAGGRLLDNNAMTDQDGTGTARPKYQGYGTETNASYIGLADVAKYYYDKDLRTSDLGNCTGSLGIDVCENNVFTTSSDSNSQQHMTTFTLGLGVDGTLSYVSDYKTATSGDYYKLKSGTGSVDWPVPKADTETAVDDLWHAAVNGQGTYFSAKDPAQLASGLSAALTDIGSKIGAASAAATSTLNPVAGNNFAYVASYSTLKWQGNLEARTINVDTGVVSQAASWCVENVVAGTCPTPGAVVAESVGESMAYYCVTPDATSANCNAPGILDGSNCKVPMTTSCTGTLQGKVAKYTDTRNIFKNDGSNVLQSFSYANLNADDFTGTGLSQWSVLTTAQKALAAGENLVKFLRGQTGYEDRGSNPATDRLYRFREATLGDALESQPFFISKPVFSYSDPGYSAFKEANASRPGTVYMGTNDGMLHAFNSANGNERWAYVPTAVIPNMWKLADKNYSNNHVNFVNGTPIISDVCVAFCDGAGGDPEWKTILVGGLNAGGRSYYALDITDPDSPSLLWEITPSTPGFSNLGYSYSQPIITKKQDGTWVVLVASGYNNVSPGTGGGYLYVINPTTGAKISEIGTNVGSTSTPSGLAKIAAWNEYGGINNTAGYVYGGDLLGNLWRFDINAGTAFLFATLKDPSNNPQPITTTPTLGKVKGYRVVLVGTGKYLEVSDLVDTSIQSIYAIKDNDAASTLINARTALVQQSLYQEGTKRKGTSNVVDFTTGRGWYIDLGSHIDNATDATFVGERLNIDMKLVQGTLIAATIVPSNTVCSPGGYGWLNYFDFETGGYISTTNLVSVHFDSPIVGINVIYINGKPIVETITATNPTPTILPDVEFKGGSSAFTGKRVMWRELIP